MKETNLAMMRLVWWRDAVDGIYKVRVFVLQILFASQFLEYLPFSFHSNNLEKELLDSGSLR